MTYYERNKERIKKRGKVSYKEKIYNFLKENKNRRFKGSELMLNLGIPEQALYHHLKNFVKRKEINKSKGRYWIDS